ncbi:hypothetical protein SSX86_030212 [Deinandra increscens subsp. villosa]|uniref:SOSEKI DIX-like domain-containing protein n=1 Tax=Deinandra increscens subsp. villosa TaxID=3103831 RepID=A0AAP0GIG1_9ASTR
MAASYSWSSKRSYKNGFLWHDLAENDFIYPAHCQGNIQKGSELFDARDSLFRFKSDEALSSISKKVSSSETLISVDEFQLPVDRNRRNQSRSGIDLHEYKVHSGKSSAVDRRPRLNSNRLAPQLPESYN